MKDTPPEGRAAPTQGAGGPRTRKPPAPESTSRQRESSELHPGLCFSPSGPGPELSPLSGGASQDHGCPGGGSTPGPRSALTGSAPRPWRGPAPLAGVTAVTGLSVPGAGAEASAAHGVHQRRCGCFSSGPGRGSQGWGPHPWGGSRELSPSGPGSHVRPALQRPRSAAHVLTRQPPGAERETGTASPEPCRSGARNRGVLPSVAHASSVTVPFGGTENQVCSKGPLPQCWVRVGGRASQGLGGVGWAPGQTFRRGGWRVLGPPRALGSRMRWGRAWPGVPGLRVTLSPRPWACRSALECREAGQRSLGKRWQEPSRIFLAQTGLFAVVPGFLFWFPVALEVSLLASGCVHAGEGPVMWRHNPPTT